MISVFTEISVINHDLYLSKSAISVEFGKPGAPHVTPSHDVALRLKKVVTPGLASLPDSLSR